jgi:hypothetical protein
MVVDVGPVAARMPRPILRGAKAGGKSRYGGKQNKFSGASHGRFSSADCKMFNASSGKK